MNTSTQPQERQAQVGDIGAIVEFRHTEGSGMATLVIATDFSHANGAITEVRHQVLVHGDARYLNHIANVGKGREVAVGATTAGDLFVSVRMRSFR